MVNVVALQKALAARFPKYVFQVHLYGPYRVRIELEGFGVITLSHSRIAERGLAKLGYDPQKILLDSALDVVDHELKELERGK